jgi:hypothetical protein
VNDCCLLLFEATIDDWCHFERAMRESSSAEYTWLAVKARFDHEDQLSENVIEYRQFTGKTT